MRCTTIAILRFFGLPEQLAVVEFVPSDLARKRNLITRKTAGNGIWRAVVE